MSRTAVISSSLAILGFSKVLFTFHVLPCSLNRVCSGEAQRSLSFRASSKDHAPVSMSLLLPPGVVTLMPNSDQLMNQLRRGLTKRVVKSTASGYDKQGLCHGLSMSPLGNYLTTLSLSFFICKREIIILT